MDKQISQVQDENGKMVAIDRVAQRMEAWLVAKETKRDIDSNPANQAVRNCAERIAKATGFFSIWMNVFDGDLDMKMRLLNAFQGTTGSGCFDPATMNTITPAPNPDGLSNGGKI